MPDTPTRLTNESGEWVSIPLTQEELDAMEAASDDQDLDFQPVRGMRDNLLRDSDWTQVADGPMTAEKVAEWATYRQELRDYPSQSDKVSTLPAWPTQPE